ncbi:hypothetical protein E2C01_079372 [Portunus trituberculatus]|uniref:Uncharacterized protein n=1 Tax=Portunus trituberculatus TaxID=210409 RepID=A0A5B7IT72_PORTR|nr:hypothetical protein [Portunus trituberculatus]
MQNLACPRCVWEEEDGGGDGWDEDVGLEVNGDELEVQQSWFLGDILDCEVGADRAVGARVAAAWGRW